MSQWEMVKLGDVSIRMHQGINTVADKVEYQNLGYPIIQSKNITKGYLDLDDVRYLNLKSYEKYCEKYNPRVGDILVANIGTIGKSFVIKNEDQFLIAWNLFKIELDQKVVKPNYLVFYFEYLHNIRYWDKLLTGGTVKFINKTKMSDIKIPLPPIEIQQKIAKILDAAAALLKLRKQQLAELDLLIQSVFYELFGDPVTNEMGWEKPSIEEVVSQEKNALKAGPFGSALKKECYIESGYKIYGQEQVISGDVTLGDYYISEKKYQELENCSVKEGDILISLVGTYGKLLIMPECFQPGIINPRLMKITFDKAKVNATYFKYFFTSDSIKRSLAANTHGGTMPILNLGIVRKTKIPLPPFLLQTKFATIVEKIEQQKALVQQSIDETQALFDSLMSRYFE